MRVSFLAINALMHESMLVSINLIISDCSFEQIYVINTKKTKTKKQKKQLKGKKLSVPSQCFCHPNRDSQVHSEWKQHFCVPLLVSSFLCLGSLKMPFTFR
jgi:hypothetical protein